MHNILEFLHGKKASIVAVVTTTTAFLALKSILDTDTATYINTIMAIIAFGADYATTKKLGTTRK